MLNADRQPTRSIAFVKQPILLVPFALGSVSIASLLLYFNGVMPFSSGVLCLLLPAIAVLAVFALWVRKSGRVEVYDRVLAGLWAGALATLAYDVVRVPIVMSGVPVFKAISYFGTVMVDQDSPTLGSEIAGWSYHFSNGMGFALMYTAMVTRPRWWTAVAWGLILELAMLVTPYAEVFGYKVSSKFLWITIGSHVVYGLVLWGALKYWLGGEMFGKSPARARTGLLAVFALAPLGIGLVAADFHNRQADIIPPSPPAYIGPHLYVTWNVLDPDRVAAMWVYQRFVNPKARFHLIPPFTGAHYGTPFDIPEAQQFRRSGTQSATEVLLEQSVTRSDENLFLLARMAHLYEITPWRIPADRPAQQLGQGIKSATQEYKNSQAKDQLRQAFQYLDQWYNDPPSP